MEKDKKLLEEQEAVQNSTGYQSKWQSAINNLITQTQNREPFKYNVNEDALYKQLTDQYSQQGKMAMMDTMGQAAAMTGGYGNSYAQSVGQQTYQGYMNQMNNMLPDLYNMALNRYMNEGDQMYNQLNLMMQQDDIDYGRYRDQMADRENEYSKLVALMTNYGYTPTADEMASAGMSNAQMQAIMGLNKPVVETVYVGGPTEPPVVKYGDGIDTARNTSGGLKGSAWDYTKNNLQQLVRSGNSAAVDNYMGQISGEMSEEQFNEAIKIIEGKK